MGEKICNHMTFMALFVLNIQSHFRLIMVTILIPLRNHFLFQQENSNNHVHIKVSLIRSLACDPAFSPFCGLTYSLDHSPMKK